MNGNSISAGFKEDTIGNDENNTCFSFYPIIWQLICTFLHCWINTIYVYADKYEIHINLPLLRNWCVSKARTYKFYICRQHHVQHLSSVGGADVVLVPSGDGFEAENSINFLGQSILFHSLLSFTL